MWSLPSRGWWTRIWAADHVRAQRSFQLLLSICRAARHHLRAIPTHDEKAIQRAARLRSDYGLHPPVSHGPGADPFCGFGDSRVRTFLGGFLAADHLGAGAGFLSANLRRLARRGGRQWRVRQLTGMGAGALRIFRPPM